ncbi:SDR family NAD(P)-dependent oxidoreductase, partial [Paraburkholderia sediminicola]|uniref:SDR family NAD(P)-dependent oxidoreductase n=1 Tax=Paraburkholderia sediminicola TaxID=458836 RepID=UPI0038BA21B7
PSTALVTGASRGLGEVFAESLAKRGANLVLVARSFDALRGLAERLTAQYGVECVPLAFDLSDPQAAASITAEIERRDIQIDLLVNNAGFGLTGPFLSHDVGRTQEEILVNVHTLVALTHFLGAGMAARRKGGVINIASNASFQPLPFMATYAASKAFVLHFSEALNYELAESGVHVMAACPGSTATRFFDGISTNLSPGDMDSAESVVERTFEAFDRREIVAYPGRSSVRALSWLPRWLPRSVIVHIAAVAMRKMGLKS